MPMIRKGIFAIVVAFVALLTLNRCVIYQRYPLPQSRLVKIKEIPLNYYLIDSYHPLTHAWAFEVRENNGGVLQGQIQRKPADTARDLVTVRGSWDAEASKKDVLLFVKPELATALRDTQELILRHKDIERIEVYESNFNKTVLVNGVTTGSIITVLYLLIAANR
jgi:hypothetical protein